MTINLETQIKEIVIKEFTALIENIEGDFKKNVIRKRNNFLLNQFDKRMIAYMVFVSSFESKSGNAIEACAKEIAKLRFGQKNVPDIVNPNNIHLSAEVISKIEAHSVHGGQVIVSNVNTDDADLRGKITQFREANKASGRGTISGVTQSSIQELYDIAQNYIVDEIHIKPVDLAFYDGNHWTVTEIKAGGDLDSSNAPSNIDKLLTIYVGLNVRDAKIYFSTLYNKNGEGNQWTGIAKKHMAYPEMFLIGSEFWNAILPGGIDFECFTKLYREALVDIKLNDRINSMIEETLKNNA